MTKKDYIKAAKIVHNMRVGAHTRDRVISDSQRFHEESVALEMEDTFVMFFRDDNPRFDEKRFRQACQA